MITKKFKMAFIMLMTCTVALSSCKKDKKDPSTTSGLSAKVDGTAKTSKSLIAVYYQSEKTLQIISTVGGTESIGLMISDIKTGTFDIANDGVIATYATTSSFDDTYLGNSGSATVTAFGNGTVSGTFSFTAKTVAGATKTITEGKFTTKYTTQ